MTEFLLQKLADRGQIYARPPGIWFSQELKRWMITSPELIRQVMHDDAFSVPSFDYTRVEDALGIDLRHLNELRNFLPLAHEGERHKVLRARMARNMARNMPAALDVLSSGLEDNAYFLLNQKSDEAFCLIENILRPTMLRALIALAGLEISSDLPLEAIPQMFDDAISPRRRKAINDLIREIVAQSPEAWTNDEKYLACAVIAAGVNTLIGSIGQTCLEVLKSSPTDVLSDMSWECDLVRTSLPLVDKYAVRDASIGPYQIKSGSRIRLFLESDGMSADGAFHSSDLFFAIGPYKCLGLNFSKQAWSKFAAMMASIPRRLRAVDMQERSGDYVFNYPETIKVQFNG